tara:strand:- start:95 stop:1141 length:1047 start_codon:yes stop_codon:yes gene_type:complete
MVSAEDFEKVVLGEKNLKGLDLSGADLRGRDLSGKDLSGSNLENAKLDDTDLRNADLSEVSLWNEEVFKKFPEQRPIRKTRSKIKINTDSIIFSSEPTGSIPPIREDILVFLINSGAKIFTEVPKDSSGNFVITEEMPDVTNASFDKSETHLKFKFGKDGGITRYVFYLEKNSIFRKRDLSEETSQELFELAIKIGPEKHLGDFLILLKLAIERFGNERSEDLTRFLIEQSMSHGQNPIHQSILALFTGFVSEEEMLQNSPYEILNESNEPVSVTEGDKQRIKLSLFLFKDIEQNLDTLCQNLPHEFNYEIRDLVDGFWNIMDPEKMQIIVARILSPPPDYARNFYGR